ncbi:hypothetical protein OAN61_01125 [bacterium]|nr:hypothetical protein [bacterium]
MDLADAAVKLGSTGDGVLWDAHACLVRQSHALAGHLRTQQTVRRGRAGHTARARVCAQAAHDSGGTARGQFSGGGSGGERWQR